MDLIQKEILDSVLKGHKTNKKHKDETKSSESINAYSSKSVREYKTSFTRELDNNELECINSNIAASIEDELEINKKKSISLQTKTHFSHANQQKQMIQIMNQYKNFIC